MSEYIVTCIEKQDAPLKDSLNYTHLFSVCAASDEEKRKKTTAVMKKFLQIEADDIAGREAVAHIYDVIKDGAPYLDDSDWGVWYIKEVEDAL